MWVGGRGAVYVIKCSILQVPVLTTFSGAWTKWSDECLGMPWCSYATAIFFHTCFINAMCTVCSHKDGWTALHCVTIEGQLDCIKWLVRNTSLMIDHRTEVSIYNMLFLVGKLHNFWLWRFHCVCTCYIHAINQKQPSYNPFVNVLLYMSFIFDPQAFYKIY